MKHRYFVYFCAVCACLLLTAAFAPHSVFASAAYETLSAAQAVTHRDGPFKLRGECVSALSETIADKTVTSYRYYRITGYDSQAAETYVLFETQMPDPRTGYLKSGPWTTQTGFFIEPEAIYMRTTHPYADWTKRDITALLEKFVSMGILDQFFILEILNGGRLDAYKDYMLPGEDAAVSGEDCRTVNLDIARTQSGELADILTKDIKTLLGPAARGMPDFQLTLMQIFTRNMITSMDADLHFTVYISRESGRVVKIAAKTNMADPYAYFMPGKISRIETESFLSLYDFGKYVNPVRITGK